MRASILTMLAVACTGLETQTDPVITDFETDFETCAEVREEASLLPANLLLAVDRSGSMADGEPVTKWEAASAAYTTFLSAQEAAILNVALRLWPDLEVGCDNETCSAEGCSEVSVPLGPVTEPDHLASLLDAIESVEPEGYTPMSAMMETISPRKSA